MRKTVPQVLDNTAKDSTQDRGHSFSQYRQTQAGGLHFSFFSLKLKEMHSK